MQHSQRIRTSPKKSRPLNKKKNTTKSTIITKSKRKSLLTSPTAARSSANAASPAVNNDRTNNNAKIMVHSGELFQDLLEDIEAHQQDRDIMSPTTGQHDDDFPTRYEPQLGTKKMTQQHLIKQAKSRHQQEAQRRWEQIEKATQRAVQKAKSKREERFRKQYADLMEERQHFLSKVDKHLLFTEEDNMYGIAKLHERWTKEVFEPIQQSVMTQVEMNGDEARKHRMVCFERFLRADGSKEGGVFRDIVDEEYNPLEAHDATIRYTTSSSKDPVKFSETKRQEEETMRNTFRSEGTLGSSGPIMTSPLNKVKVKAERMEPTMWDKAEATPAGRYSHQNPKNYAKPHEKTKSTIPLEHFKVPNAAAAQELLQKEIGPGKRIYKERISQKNMKDFSTGYQAEKIQNSGKRVTGYKGQQTTLKIG